METGSQRGRQVLQLGGGSQPWGTQPGWGAPHHISLTLLAVLLSQKRIWLLHLHQCLNDENSLQFILHFDWNHSSAPGLSLISRVAFWGEVSVEGSFVGGPVRWAWGWGRRQVLRPNFPFLRLRIGIVETQGHPGISSGWIGMGTDSPLH